MLHPQTIEHIRGLSDELLISYVAIGVEMYEPEAVEFAQAECDRRQLDPALLARAKGAVVVARHVHWARADQAAAQAAVAPLDWADKTIAFVAGFFFPLTFIHAIIWIMRLHERGERRKAVQWPIYAAVGAGSMLIFAVVAVATGLVTTR